MGYTPRIILEFEDLEKHSTKLQEDEFSGKFEQGGEEGETVPSYLLNRLRDGLKYPCKLKGKNILIFQPEFTSYNEEVRNYLNDLEVEYALDN